MGSWSLFTFVPMCGSMERMALKGVEEKAVRSKEDEVRSVLMKHHD